MLAGIIVFNVLIASLLAGAFPAAQRREGREERRLNEWLASLTPQDHPAGEPRKVA